MTDYYFIGTYIPKLQIGAPLEITVEEFISLLKENLSSKDWARLVHLHLYFDLINIQFFWMGQKILPYGNFNENTLEEALLTRKGFPEYVYHFLDTYETSSERIRNFSKLYANYYTEEIAKSEGFLRSFLEEERTIRLLLVALRAKKLGRPLLPELQFEDPNQDLVAFLLAQKDAKILELPEEYAELKTLYENFCEKPLDLHQALIVYRFQQIDKKIGLQTFTSDRLFAYYIQLVLVDEWIRLDEKKGRHIINTIVQENS